MANSLSRAFDRQVARDAERTREASQRAALTPVVTPVAETRQEQNQPSYFESKGFEIDATTGFPINVDRDAAFKNIRDELQNQYDNLVAYDPKLAYKGRSSDLPKIFDQQANQLANAGVASITSLRRRNSKLVDISQDSKVINTTNLKGQIATDRDTGAVKWGDIFSGVKGGANYGVSFDDKGSPIFYPVYEKSKSPIAQIGLGGLESVIAPILTIGGAFIGVPGLGAIGGAAAGAAAGNTTGQLLASGKVDWEQVALSAAGAGAGQAVFGGAGAEATPVAETGTMAISTPAPGSFQAALPDLGVQTAATTPGFTALPGSFQAALPSLISPVNAMGDTAQGLLNQDLQFLAEETANLYQASGGDLNAVQQNLIANGVDPVVAAEAANQASLSMGNAAFYDVSGAVPVLKDAAGQFAAGMSGIAGGVGSAFPGEALITSQGLLGGGATLDEFAKDIAGISSSSTPALSITDALRGANLANQLMGGGQQTATGFPQQQAPFQPTGVDYSGIYGLLGQRASVPGISSLLGPAQLRFPSLLG